MLEHRTSSIVTEIRLCHLLGKDQASVCYMGLWAHVRCRRGRNNSNLFHRLNYTYSSTSARWSNNKWGFIPQFMSFVIKPPLLFTFLLLRSIMGRSAMRAVKGFSSRCHMAAAQSLCLCPVAARWQCMPSTQGSWSPCSGVTTTTLTAVSSTQTTR